jgi:hypothetical protein
MSALETLTAEWEAAIGGALAKAEPVRSYRLPDPAAYAQQLPSAFAEALRHAWLCERGWRVDVAGALAMRPHGLVDYSSPCLTAFGIACRRALIGTRAERSP